MKLNTLLFAVLFICISCQRADKEETSSTFDFNITGEVINGDGLTLALYLPSQGLDNRITSTVVDGKYSFKGRADYVEKGIIRFEENIVHESSMYTTWPIIIEPGTVDFNIEIEGDSLMRSIGNFELLTGPNNLYFYEVVPLLSDVASYRIYSDPVKSDSMHRLIYPKVKSAIIHALDSVILANRTSEVAPILLNLMIEDFGAFEFKRLTTNERSGIVNIFEAITSNKFSPGYLTAQRNIELIENSTGTISFKDYDLKDYHSQDVKLSDLTKSTEYTVLYFWWTGCLPCREFNRTITPEDYNELKENGIELVSISTDESALKWKNASDTDGISWVNLYAGKLSGIEQDYGVRAYPTKVVLTSELQVVDFKFSTLEDLAGLTE